jgi:hypothetical protein
VRSPECLQITESVSATRVIDKNRLELRHLTAKFPGTPRLNDANLFPGWRAAGPRIGKGELIREALAGVDRVARKPIFKRESPLKQGLVFKATALARRRCQTRDEPR